MWEIDLPISFIPLATFLFAAMYVPFAAQSRNEHIPLVYAIVAVNCLTWADWMTITMMLLLMVLVGGIIKAGAS